jgi:protein-disulfide isomerase
VSGNTKSGKRGEAARRAQEVAAKRLAAAKAAERRRRALVVGAVVVAVLLIAGVVGYGVYRSQKVPSAAQVTAPAAAGGGTGITIGTGGPTADIYLDFLCPNCKTLEDQLGATVDQLIAQGSLKVSYHPVAILDESSSGTKYSTRSGSAAACASDAGALPAYLKQLYSNQPAEGSTGLTDDKLVELGTAAGITNAAADAFGSCVRSRKYADWMTANTDQFSRDGLRGTPTVKLNGKVITGNQLSVEGFTAAVKAAT